MTIKLQSNLYVRIVNTFPNFYTDMIFGLFLSLIPRCTNDTLRMMKYLHSLLYPHSTEDEWGYTGPHNSFQTWHLHLWGESLGPHSLPSILTLWWPNISPKINFMEFL